MNCINCNNKHNYDFCPNCGEKSKTQKITCSTILTDGFSSVVYSLIHNWYDYQSGRMKINFHNQVNLYCKG